MTATRIVRGATIAVGGAVWVVLAVLLWRTTVLALARRLGRGWWLAAAPALTLILLALQLVAPYPASVGTHPVRSPRLRSEVRSLEQREHAGRPVVRIADVSGRTRAANAF